MASHPGAPADTYIGNGLLGQRVIVVPSQDLVIVRLGLNFNNDFDQVGCAVLGLSIPGTGIIVFYSRVLPLQASVQQQLHALSPGLLRRVGDTVLHVCEHICSLAGG